MKKYIQQVLPVILGVVVMCASSAPAQSPSNSPSISLTQTATPSPQMELNSETKLDSATPQSSPSQTPQSEEARATQALYEYLAKNQIKVIIGTLGSDIVWTDSVMLEVTKTLPPDPMGGFLTHIPADEGELVRWFGETFEKQQKSWQPAKRKVPADHEGTEEVVNDKTGAHCFLNPIYVAYILSRYPDAAILMKTPTDPVLFTVKGQICAVIVPWTKLPDGTPLS